MSNADAYLILETERLLLRRQRAEDVPFLMELWTDPEVTRHLNGPRDRARLQAALDEVTADPFADTYDLWPVIEKASGTLVGHCGLLDKEVDGRAEIELVYIFARSAWGKGYAAEMGRALIRHAFDTLGLARLIALIEPENAASERAAARIGMRFEKDVTRPGGAPRKVYALERGAQPESG